MKLRLAISISSDKKYDRLEGMFTLSNPRLVIIYIVLNRFHNSFRDTPRNIDKKMFDTAIVKIELVNVDLSLSSYPKKL